MILIVPGRAEQNQGNIVEMIERGPPVDFDQRQPRPLKGRTQGTDLEIMFECVPPTGFPAGKCVRAS